MVQSEFSKELTREFLARKKRNARYSLRSFARELSLSPAFLSQLLNGRRQASVDAFYQISNACGWQESHSTRLLNTLAVQKAKNPKVRSALLHRMARVNPKPSTPLKDDALLATCDWLHTAILELSFAEQFKEDPRWIAKKLGVTTLEVAPALARLKNLKLLVYDKSGQLRKAEDNQHTPDDVPVAAVRKFHFDMLRMAQAALERQSLSSREFQGITVATDPTLIPEIKAKIRRFTDELMEFMESGERTEIFHFSGQLFKVDGKLRM